MMSKSYLSIKYFLKERNFRLDLEFFEKILNNILFPLKSTLEKLIDIIMLFSKLYCRIGHNVFKYVLLKNSWRTLITQCSLDESRPIDWIFFYHEMCSTIKWYWQMAMKLQEKPRECIFCTKRSDESQGFDHSKSNYILLWTLIYRDILACPTYWKWTYKCNWSS